MRIALQPHLNVAKLNTVVYERIVPFLKSSSARASTFDELHRMPEDVQLQKLNEFMLTKEKKCLKVHD